MNLIKLNGLVPTNPSSYDVEFADVNGEDSKLEDGYNYVEQVRADVPTIKVSWTNLTETEVEAITTELSNGSINVTYFYCGMNEAEMTTGARSLKLKSIDSQGNCYWNLSVTLQG